MLLMGADFKILLFTSPDSVKDEAALLNLYLENGLDYLHIRKPQWSKDRVGDLLSQIPACFHHKIKIHDHFSLTDRFDVGVCVNSRNPVAPDRISRVSTGFHSISETANADKYEYATISPVADSISKTGYGAQSSLLDAPKLTGAGNLIALGGIKVSQLGEMCERGFAGAAILGDVWNNGNKAALLNVLRRRNMRLQFITNGETVEDTVSQSLAVLAGGCRWIQIRMKDAPVEAITEVISEVAPKCHQAGCNILVDDHVEIAAKGIVDGVHLGKKDMNPVEARKMLNSTSIIGFTANSTEDVRNTLALPVDYLGVGPLRQTTTKKNAASPLGIDTYRRLTPGSDFNKPYVAIGGVTIDDIDSLMTAGAMGVAVSAAVIKASSPVAETQKFMKILNQYNNYLSWKIY